MQKKDKLQNVTQVLLNQKGEFFKVKPQTEFAVFLEQIDLSNIVNSRRKGFQTDPFFKIPSEE